MKTSNHINDYLQIADHVLNQLMDGSMKASDAKEINNALGKAAQFLKTKVIYEINRNKGGDIKIIEQIEDQDNKE